MDFYTAIVVGWLKQVGLPSSDVICLCSFWYFAGLFANSSIEKSPMLGFHGLNLELNIKAIVFSSHNNPSLFSFHTLFFLQSCSSHIWYSCGTNMLLDLQSVKTFIFQDQIDKSLLRFDSWQNWGGINWRFIVMTFLWNNIEIERATF